MTIQQIENLLAAGFNHDEIMHLARDEPADQKKEDPADQKKEDPADQKKEDPADQKKEDPADQKKEDPADQKKEAAPENTETNNRLDALEKSIATLVKSIQSQNVKKDSYGGMPDSLEQQTDKIMMSIIRPDFERKAN